MPSKNTLALYCPEADQQSWLQALSKAMPDSEIVLWPQTSPEAQFAAAWMPNDAFIQAHPHLRYLFNLGAGVDALLRLPLPEDLHIVRIEDGGMAEQMFEYIYYAVLRHVRQFGEYEKNQAQGLWQPFNHRSWSDYPIGVLGLGALGGYVACELAKRGLAVNGWSQSPKKIDGVKTFAAQTQFDEFLASSRILVCLLPLTTQTQGILNKRNLLKLMPQAYLINVARGAHLVEEDLLDLLETGHVSGAMLDVTKLEPLPQHHPFWRHPSINITPHVSAQTICEAAATQIAHNIARITENLSPLGLVNRQRGY